MGLALVRLCFGHQVAWLVAPTFGSPSVPAPRWLITAGTVSVGREQKDGDANKKRSDVPTEMIEQAGQYSQRIAVTFDNQNSQALALRRQSFCWIVTHSRLRSPNSIFTPTSPRVPRRIWVSFGQKPSS